MKAAAGDTSLLIQIIREAYDEETWNGTNLKSSLARVTPEIADWLPPGARRRIVEHVVHCAFWKYRLRRSMREDERGGFAFKGEDWFEIESPLTSERWEEILALLDAEQANVIDAIDGTELTFESERELVRKVFGLALHDAYHTGQIRLIKAMQRNA